MFHSDLHTLCPAYKMVKQKELKKIMPQTIQTIDEFEEIKVLAEKNPEQQHKLGLMYLLGEGVAENQRKARLFLRRAAKQAHAKAQNDYAAMSLVGALVYVQTNSVKLCLEMAKKQGLVEPLFWMGILLLLEKTPTNNPTKARELHEEAEQNGLDELYVEIIHKLRDSGAYEEKKKRRTRL